MRLIKKVSFGMLFLIVVICFSNFFSASYMESDVQAFQYSKSDTSLSQATCQEGQDFIIQIVPFGCTPAVVRTDLLEEQDVPVFCQLGATKINPLIDVEAIDSISFSGNYPREVSGIGFHPAKSALGVEKDLNSPILENIGYVVITLRKQGNASAIPDVISGNLTAKIKYNIKEAFGIGKALFYIPEFAEDEDWEAKKYQYGFWNDKGYLKVDEITSEGAQISIYREDDRISSVTLKKGETSDSIYIPGFECNARMKLKLGDIDKADTRAQLRINAEIVEVADEERFLDNKCQVKNIVPYGIVQRVTLSCQEDKGRKNFDLAISPKLILRIDNKEEEYGVGDFLYKEGTRSIFLGYIGTKGSADKKEDLFIYLVSLPDTNANKLSAEELANVNAYVGDFVNAGHKEGVLNEVSDFITKVLGTASRAGRAIISGQTFCRINFGGEGKSIVWITPENAGTVIIGKTVSIVDFAGAKDMELTGNFKENYENAIEDYETIIESFSSEPYGSGTYGEETLYQEIMLALKAEQKKTVLELCREFKGSYPNSNKDLSDCNNVYKLSSLETREVYVTINGELKSISLEGISEPTWEEYGVTVLASTPKGVKSFQLRKNQYASETGFSLQLISAEDNSAKIKISISTDKINLAKIVDLNNDITEDIAEGYSFTLTEVKLKKVAKVSLIPNINNAGTQADFGFRIGVERRLIQLSPKQIKSQIEKLDKSIGTWQNISNVLGDITKGLKTACLVTGATLVLKNLIENSGGAGIARQYVMRGVGGWYSICTNMTSKGAYVSIDHCLAENADTIDKEVDKFTKLMNNQNAQIKKLEDTAVSKEFLLEKVINTDKFAEDYVLQVKSCLNGLPDTFTYNEKTVSKADVLTALSFPYNEGKYSIEQLRRIELFCQAYGDPTLKELSTARLYSVFTDVSVASRQANETKSIQDELAGRGYKDITVRPLINEKAVVEVYDGGANSAGVPSQGVVIDNVPYVFTLSPIENTNNKYSIDKVYNKDGGLITDTNTLTSIKTRYSYFQRYDSSSYKNTYRNAEVSYYETEPYNGMPAIVPFDTKSGWYAAIKGTLGAGTNIASYEESGRVNSFYLCNVGEDGMEENIGGDDICQMINTGTGQAYNVFPGLSESEAKSTISKAIQAIEQASRAYKSGLSGKISILGEKIKVGAPAVSVPDFQCQDFMSPKDCLLLFNVCDPVTCPSSRCDLGGAYPVKDVVQSGVIGSIALCLPNAREGILFPVCLTGVKAGIDGFLSVKQSYKDCLQESLETGKMVGICDEIYSIYICDFFWKQALPIADLIIPRLIGGLLGQNVRGGGEYLNVASAWEGADNAISYFLNYYGANSKNAFVARTTELLGEEICKLYTSAVVPSGADLISELTSPDSPVQFHGRFDESTLTTATVPPQSHYKVFYHIYAGADSGAYYKVYLKGTAGSSYYQDTSSSYTVASGYIAVGGYATETKDFTAVSGYKQLCINVNGQEECGFKEVSTSFALNYIEDEYLASQAAETDIRTENECISGSASAYSLLNPNVQSGAEALLNPEIYNQGIIRICATENPGLGTDAKIGTNEARWKQVGVCGSERMKCWLDTQSVENVIKTTTVEGEALDEVSDNYLDVLKAKGNYLSESEYESKITEITAEKEPSNQISLINEIIERVFFSKEKVELVYLRGNAYAETFRRLWSGVKPEVVAYEPSERNLLETETQPTEEPTVTGETVGYKIWEAAKELVEADWDEFRITNVAKDTRDYRNVCTRFTIHSMVNAGVKTEGIIYRETSAGSIENMDNLIPIFEKSSDFIEIASGDWNSLEKGDLIMLGYGSEKTQHMGIFDSYADVLKKQIKIYGDPTADRWLDGVRLPSGRAQLEGMKYPLVAAHNPPKSGDWYVYRVFRYVGDLAEREETEPEEVTETPSKSITMGEKILEYASDITIGGSSDNAPKFVATTLAAAGVEEESIGDIVRTSVPTVASFASALEEINNLVEVKIDNTLKAGDVLLIGKGCDVSYSAAVFSNFADNAKTISFYTNLKGTVALEKTPFNSQLLNDMYIYKAYRYAPETSDVRERSTLIEAIEEANKRTGKYDANKQFVDQLIYDGLLTEKECSEVRGAGLLSFQKDMLWVKKTLLAKCNQDKACRDTFGLS